jgi:hypothetical protein
MSYPSSELQLAEGVCYGDKEGKMEPRRGVLQVIVVCSFCSLLVGVI